jgi:hypothetical protein
MQLQSTYLNFFDNLMMQTHFQSLKFSTTIAVNLLSLKHLLQERHNIKQCDLVVHNSCLVEIANLTKSQSSIFIFCLLLFEGR